MTSMKDFKVLLRSKTIEKRLKKLPIIEGAQEAFEEAVIETAKKIKAAKPKKSPGRPKKTKGADNELDG